MTKELSRRSFITAAAIGAAGAAAGLAAGCSKPASTDSGTQAGTGTAATEGTSTGVTLYDDLDSRYDISSTAAIKEPIVDDQITETKEADIVIVGAGISGAIAAATCAEAGKTTIVLQKAETALSHGWGIAACNTQAQKDAGYEPDWLDIINRWNRAGENRADMPLVIKNWIGYSGEVIDWLYGLVNDVEGVGPMIAPPNIGATYDTEWTQTYATAHGWMGEMQAVSQWLIDYAVDMGMCEVLYSTPGVQLKTDASGAVIGCIGQQEDGSFVLAKGASTILAAGDYGHNPGLRAEFMPHCEGLPSAYSRMDNTGDGILMGYWIGGVIQKSPHCGNIHYDPPVNYPDVPGSGQPWLSVNQLGERFANEDVVYGQIYAQDMNQPGLMHWQVFDGDFKEQCGTIGSGMMRTEPFPGYGDQIEACGDEGLCKRADTLEELADQMGVPVDAFVATVERYNELYDMGKDVDFGKKAEYLTPIRKAPFYAVARQAGVLCTLNGLLTDVDMRVIDADRNVIPGLYAVGNCQGGWFGGLEHQMMVPGMSLGRAATTGRVAAKRACGIAD